jgi:eukaryotic-like serine/threonine-protein kinase
VTAQWRCRVDAIYRDALEQRPADRAALVANRCGGDATLRRRVEALLDASDRAEAAFAGAWAGIRGRCVEDVFGARHAEPEEEDLADRVVGPWRLDQRIARGGLATVYRAHREDGAFEQRVAVKVLRRGLDTDDIVRRFAAERQILSSLEHPGITRILDGGALDDGRPYLVLDYVDGTPINAYCRGHDLDLCAKIRLLAQVADALHHAHRHLIVHRDVKPGNILVSEDGRIHLLDFGIAKLLDPGSLPVQSAVTRVGLRLLTPEYASPEQLRGDAITTASDVYQLGLVAYELVTGERPYADGVDRETTPAVPPSRRLRVRGARDHRELRGDLDAIVLKALRAEPDQRYTSADEFSADLRRCLSGMPVSARPDSVAYRVGKLLRRQPWLAPTMLLAALATAGYVVTITLHMRRIAEDERLASATQHLLVDLFRSPDPLAPGSSDKGRSITVVDALDIGEKRIRDELAAEPDLRASLLRTISQVYQSLDVFDSAIALREEALALERSLYGEDSPQVVDSLGALGRLYAASGDNERANRTIHEYYELAREVLDEEDPQLGLADTALGTMAFTNGDLAGADRLLSRGIERLLADPQTYVRAIIEASATLSETRIRRDDRAGAHAALENAEAIAARQFGEGSVPLAMVRADIAVTLGLYEEYDAAEQTFAEAIDLMERVLGRNHNETLDALNNLGVMYARRGDQTSAERVQREVLARRIEKYGQHHEMVAISYQNLASALTHQGRYDESIPLHRKAYEIYRSVLAPTNFTTALPLLSVAYAELERGRATAAESAAREAVQRLAATMPDTFFLGVAECLLGLAQQREGRAGEGDALLASARPLIADSLAPDPYPELCGVTDSGTAARD